MNDSPNGDCPIYLDTCQFSIIHPDACQFCVGTEGLPTWMTSKNSTSSSGRSSHRVKELLSFSVHPQQRLENLMFVNR